MSIGRNRKAGTKGAHRKTSKRHRLHHERKEQAVIMRRYRIARLRGYTSPNQVRKNNLTCPCRACRKPRYRRRLFHQEASRCQ
jgi:hypothetical protein